MKGHLCYMTYMECLPPSATKPGAFLLENYLTLIPWSWWD